MAHKLNPKMKAWAKNGKRCRAKFGIKPFKKMTAAQKKKVSKCVYGKR